MHAARILAAGVVFVAVAFGAAGPAPQTTGQAVDGSRVTLRALVAEAMRNNPEIAAAQKKYEAARQRPTQESSLPDPMLSVGYAAVGKPWPGAGLGSQPQANIGVMASQEIPFPGKLKLKGDIAGKEAQAEFEQYQGVQLSVISRLKQAFFRLQHATSERDILERNRDLLDHLLKITEDRYSVGRAAQQDVFKAQTQISILETRLVRVEQERKTREAEINSILNRPAGSPLGVPEEVMAKDLTVTLDELLASARHNSPMLGRDQKMIERSELAVNLARKDYYPDVTLNAGYYNMGSMPPMYEVRADVKVPLYFWRKQRAGVAEQSANVSQARRDYEATDQSLRYRIQEDYLAAQTSEKLMKLYTQTVVPQSNLALEASLSTYETGTVDFLSVLTNFTMVLDYQMSYHDEALNYHLALSRLEEMTGRPLTD